MMEWKYEELTRKPSEFERLNTNQFIQRKDIEEKKKTDDYKEYTYYSCFSRIVTNDMYELLTNQMKLQSKVDYLAIMTDTEMPEDTI